MKKLIKEEIFNKDYPNDRSIVRFSDLPKDIQENDIIDIRREDSYFSENSSYDAYTELLVIREREETDDEYQKRIDEDKKFKERLKNQRYEHYLKLKEEFNK